MKTKIGLLQSNTHFVLNRIVYYLGYWNNPNGKVQALNMDTGMYEYFNYNTLVTIH